MLYRLPAIQRVIEGLFLLSLITSFGFGYFHIKNMGSMDMPMPGCPFMGEFSAVCSMSPIEHIAAWQHLFTALPATLTLLLLVCVLVLLGSRFFAGFFSPPPRLKVVAWTRCHQSRHFTTVNYLQEFLSRGILNPKLF